MIQLSLFETEKPKHDIEYERKTIVEFAFLKKNYYRLEGGEYKGRKGIGEVRGRKTLRLFKSWYNLMRSRGRLICGVVTFVDSGETWIWQPKNPFRKDKYCRGGWQLALAAK